MIAQVLLAAFLSQPLSVDYQSLGFENETDELDVQSGQMTPAQLACVQAYLPTLHPGENAADMLSLKYARQDTDRDNGCVTFTVERREAASAFVLRETEPSGAYASADGLTFYWPERLATQCLNRDANLDELNACLASFAGPPGLYTEWLVSRPNTSQPMVLQYLWEVVTRTPGQYGLDRASGARIRSHTREFPPPPEEPAP